MYDVIIIGSGPAGLTASIYTSRAQLKTCVVAGSAWGGQLMLTTKVENFPGFEEGIIGPDLMDKMLKQAKRFGAEFIFEDATSVDFLSEPFKIEVGNKLLEGRSVIIATGSSPKWLGLESETRLRGKGVSACATCDGPFFSNKNVVVVGGSDSAIEEALTLSQFAKTIQVVHRRDKLRASKILQQRAFRDPKINFIWSSIIQEIYGEDKVTGIKLKNVDSDEESKIDCDGVFVAIGWKPNSEIFRGQVEMRNGYIITGSSTETNVKGVFAAGDVHDFRYRQAVTAAGSGCKAALDVEQYLERT